MGKKQDLSKVEIPTGQFKHNMADPQFGRLVPEGDRYSFFSCSC